MRCRLNAEAQHHERQSCEAMIGRGRFFGRQAEEQREVGDGSLLQFPFVEREKSGEIAARWAGFREGRRVDVFETKFRQRSSEGARETGCLRDGSEVGQVLGGHGGVHDARSKRFDAEAGNGSERQTTHRLCGKMRRELRESQRVNALAARLERMRGEFACGGAGGGDNEDLAAGGLVSQERGSVAKERGVGARVNERTKGHR